MFIRCTGVCTYTVVPRADGNTSSNMLYMGFCARTQIHFTLSIDVVGGVLSSIAPTLSRVLMDSCDLWSILDGIVVVAESGTICWTGFSLPAFSSIFCSFYTVGRYIVSVRNIAYSNKCFFLPFFALWILLSLLSRTPTLINISHGGIARAGAENCVSMSTAPILWALFDIRDRFRLGKQRARYIFCTWVSGKGSVNGSACGIFCCRYAWAPYPSYYIFGQWRILSLEQANKITLE